jgi:hypothetical protein
MTTGSRVRTAGARGGLTLKVIPAAGALRDRLCLAGSVHSRPVVVADGPHRVDPGGPRQALRICGHRGVLCQGGDQHHVHAAQICDILEPASPARRWGGDPRMPRQGPTGETSLVDETANTINIYHFISYKVNRNLWKDIFRICASGRWVGVVATAPA